MLSRAEYLLVKLAEECAEVAQRATKALTFGVTEVYLGGPGSAYCNAEGFSDAQMIMVELADLSAVVGMLQDDGVLPVDLLGFRAMVDAKRDKLAKYMQHSRELGCLA